MATTSPRFNLLISKYLLASVRRERGLQGRSSQRGFVLPVAILITLVLALVAATVTSTSFNRSQQTTGERARQVVNNDVRLAIDRARAKLDYLLNPASQAGGRLPQGRPGNDFLVSLLLDGANVNGITAPAPVSGSSLSFKLNDENPLTLDPGVSAPAWWFNVDTDNDGVTDAVTGYAILTNTRNATDTVAVEGTFTDQEKAEELVLRNLALKAATASGTCTAAAGAGLPIDVEGSWFRTNLGGVVKPIQVVAVTVPTTNSTNDTRAISAVQMQQDRYRETLSEYGAYFRADLEVFPGPEFNWNGKVYSEANLIIGGNNSFNAYLISDPDSCYYNPSSRSSFGSAFELINGNLKENSFNVSSSLHIQDGTNNPPIITLNSGSDSVSGSATPADLAINPLSLFTEGAHVPNYVKAGTALGAFRDAGWASSALATGGGGNGKPRVELLDAGQEPPPAPYVDDFFRADNRCGPQPNYGEATLPSGCTNSGDTVDSGEVDIIAENPIGGDPTLVGLDGYWERRARLEGTRIIVGQRLNLMPGHPDNPDIPAELDLDGDGLEASELQGGVFPNGGLIASGSIPRLDEDDSDVIDFIEQSVQATAIYHHTAANLDVPIACLSTVSDATATSTQPVLNQNEFVPPDISSFNSFNTPMMIALRNLARLSSDGDDRSTTTFPTAAPDDVTLGTLGNGITEEVAGAFPPFQENNGSTKAHPNPTLIPHGNFSNLRRALELMDGGSTFNDLSIADKSYLYTAACTLGMLATDNAIAAGNAVRPSLDFDGPDNVPGTLDDRSGIGLDRRVGTADDALASSWIPTTASGFRNANYITLNDGGDGILGNSNDPIVYGSDGIPGTSNDLAYLAFDGGDGILGNAGDTVVIGSGAATATVPIDWDSSNPDRKAAAVLFNGGTRINNDGEFNAAFGNTSTNIGGIGNGGANHPLFDLRSYFAGPDGTFGNSDDLTMEEAFGLTPGGSLSDNEATRALILGAILGSDNTPGTFDDPFSGSPGNTLYGADGNFSTTGPDGIAGTADDIAPNLVDDIIRVEEGDDGIYGSDDDPTNALRTIFQGVNTNTVVLVNNGNTQLAQNIRDINTYNGRERLMVRTLDLDLGALRSLGQGGGFIFPRSGIIYASREDAVREDGIARPLDPYQKDGVPTSRPDREAVNARGSNNNDCNNFNNGGGSTDDRTTCIYVDPYQGGDPPLTTVNLALDQDAMGGVSPKPVDYYQDPLRRPYVFRLSNGRRLARNGDNNRGLSFITDASVYINGGFNAHTQFEFTNNQGVQDGNFNVAQFYGRSGLNDRFANGSNDRWRPSEILSDAISITSDTFIDNARPGNNPALFLPGVEGRYSFNNANARNTTVNAIMVSGIVPSRVRQSFGGVHNFPRFLQSWQNDNLVIAGSFIQLNYSTQATAPFDQDAWARNNNPAPDPSNPERIGYYFPPNRRWGYDVALQYAPASPIASRFDIPSNVRDEFVRDLDADDPYVRLIRCALENTAGTNVASTPGLTCP